MPALDPIRQEPRASAVGRRNGVRPARAAGAALLGCVLAVGTFTLFRSGAVPEPLCVATMLLLLAAVPVAPTLSGRVAINAALAVGWTPLLWWVHWPVDVNHGAALVSGCVGGLVGYVALSTEPRARLRSLVPAVRTAEVLLPVSALVALLATRPFSFASSPQRALTALLPGADNWAHFNMFSTLRSQGVLPGLHATGPDGSGWGFANYPKGFHALAATVSEVTFPGMRADPEALVSYAHSIGVVTALGLVMVTAAILCLPRLGDRPAIAVPVVTLTWTALLWEPGQKVMANGFASFWLAAVAAATALLLALGERRGSVLVQVAAVGGLLVCIAHTWTPLALVAAPAALMVLVAAGSGTDPREVRRRRLVVAVVVLGVALLACARAVVVLMSTVSLGFIVAEESGFDMTGALPTFVLLIGAFYVLATYPMWVARRTGRDVDPALGRRRGCSCSRRCSGSSAWPCCWSLSSRRWAPPPTTS